MKARTSPQLSRRAAQAMNNGMLAGMPGLDREQADAFIKAIEAAEFFEDLPQQIQEMIVERENAKPESKG